MLPAVQQIPNAPLSEDQLIQRAATNLNVIAQREREIAQWAQQIELATKDKLDRESENVQIKAAIKTGTPFPPQA